MQWDAQLRRLLSYGFCMFLLLSTKTEKFLEIKWNCYHTTHTHTYTHIQLLRLALLPLVPFLWCKSSVRFASLDLAFDLEIPSMLSNPIFTLHWKKKPTLFKRKQFRIRKQLNAVVILIDRSTHDSFTRTLMLLHWEKR